MRSVTGTPGTDLDHAAWLNGRDTPTCVLPSAAERDAAIARLEANPLPAARRIGASLRAVYDRTSRPTAATKARE